MRGEGESQGKEVGAWCVRVCVCMGGVIGQDGNSEIVKEMDEESGRDREQAAD